MEEENNIYRLIPRHDLSTNWMINNPILAFGEYGVEDDTHRVKRGNGVDRWESLIYEQFGLENFINFGNISGEIEDNELLAKAFESKLDIDLLQGDRLISNIQLAERADNEILINKNLIDLTNSKALTESLIIKSSDNTVDISLSKEDELKIIDLKLKAEYDNSTSGLEATTISEAIDELKKEVDVLKTELEIGKLRSEIENLKAKIEALENKQPVVTE